MQPHEQARALCHELMHACATVLGDGKTEVFDCATAMTMAYCEIMLGIAEQSPPDFADTMAGMVEQAVPLLTGMLRRIADPSSGPGVQ